MKGWQVALLVFGSLGSMLLLTYLNTRLTRVESELKEVQTAQGEGRVEV